MICAGVDAGSRAIKAVLLDAATREVVASGMADQGVAQERLAGELLDRIGADAGVARRAIRRIVATGYGRDALDFADTTVTEITCHARGVRHECPEARTIVDIGGQDSKVIRLDAAGVVRDFAMNDRCAAGTGCFLELVANRLAVTLDALGALAEASAAPAPISSTCAVFAETEIIGLLAAGGRPEDIVAGVQHAIASRVSVMVGRTMTEPAVFTGGVARIPGMDRALGAVLGHAVRVAPRPQFTGALGAALIAAEEE